MTKKYTLKGKHATSRFLKIIYNKRFLDYENNKPVNQIIVEKFF